MRAKTRLLSCALAGAFLFASCGTHPVVKTTEPVSVVAPAADELPFKKFVPNIIPTTTTTTTVPVTTTTVPRPTTTTTVPLTGTYLYQAWLRVATCEEGGTYQFQHYGPWFYSGSTYPDSLGIDAANWYGNGGTSDVSAAAQIAVAERLIHRYGASIPDQGYCQKGGW